VLKELEKKGCVKIGDVDRNGTLYEIVLPGKIKSVIEKLTVGVIKKDENDYFTDDSKRKELFERDKWTCYYCSEIVTKKNVTLGHFIPQSKGGRHNKDNLKTSCLVCNSVKSGKTYEEAAPLLLKSIREKKSKVRN